MDKAFMTISLQTIAAECGVSAMTVSRALDPVKRELLSPETRALVTAAIEKYGYEGNVSARRLKSGRQEALTLIFTARPIPPEGRTIFDAFTDARTLTMMKSALAEARRFRYELKLESSMAFGDGDEIIRRLARFAD